MMTARRRLSATVERRHSYDVRVERGLIDRYGEHLVARTSSRKFLVLTDDMVDRLFGDRLRGAFRRVGVEPLWVVRPAGESSKSLATLESLIGELAERGFDRRGTIVNFGGGVISDLGGFLASTYMRGVAYANFATTLIGQLDASIGGKVAVNAPYAKNLIGAFHQPIDVAADPGLLRTLPHRDFRSGIAEAIKVAIIAGPLLFERLEADAARVRDRDEESLTDVIVEAAHLKIELLKNDPFEADLRRALNFGHTLGHPIETASGYGAVKHGEAVAVGMSVATGIARRRGLISETDGRRIRALLAAYDLADVGARFEINEVIDKLRYVKMIRGDHLHFVLPTGIGSVVITDDVPERDIRESFEEYAAGAAR